MLYLIKPKPCDFWSYTNVDSFEPQATMTTVFFGDAVFSMLYQNKHARSSRHVIWRRKRKVPNAIDIQVPSMIIEWRPVAASFVTSSILVFLKLLSLSSKYFVLPQIFFSPSIFIFLASKYIFLKRKVFIEEISEIFKKARRFSMDWPKTSKMIAYNRTCEEKSVVWHLGAYSYRIKRFLKIYWFEYVFKPKAKVSLRYYIVKYFLEEKSRFDFHAKDLHARSNHITKLACSLTVKCLQVWAYPQQRKDSLIHIYLRLTYKWNVFDVSWLSTVKHIIRVLWLGVRMVNFCHVVSHCNFRVDFS